MVNARRTTRTFRPVLSNIENTPTCRSFIHECPDCRSRIVVRNGMIQTIWINRRSRYRIVDLVADGREEWLKGGDRVDTLCRGEVAEWLNAAVSKTVTSVIPASGVRIPPSPRCEAIQPVSTLRPSGSAFSLSARRLWISDHRPKEVVTTRRVSLGECGDVVRGDADKLKC